MSALEAGPLPSRSRVEASAPERLSRRRLHASLSDPALEAMNFLNEVAGRYPDAVSFAAGRPVEDYFDLEDLHRYIRLYCDYLRTERGYDEAAVTRLLFQYGPSRGLINELISRNLAVDEGIEADPRAVVVTVGCQEAMYLVLRALRAEPSDVLLAASPNYVGITGAARLADMAVLPVPESAAGIDADGMVRAAERARARGLNPRACYLVPDFANPSGASLTVGARRRLLDAAREQDLLLLEDNPYGLFRVDGERPPTIKALDRRAQVVYLGSFAKTGLPGARVGYAVADQEVTGEGGASLLADELAKLKSMLTVNTPPLAQAVIAGRLIEHGFSLVRANTREAAVYRRNLRLVLDGLARRFPPGNPAGVRWNVPAGGFFLVLSVPFAADDAALADCAREHGVLWTPMYRFYDGGGGREQLRLSVSSLTPQQIETGLGRLAEFINLRT